MRRYLREPLLHFVVIGAVLFALPAVFDRTDDEPRDRIVISHGLVRNIVATFRLRWQRAPTKTELDGLIAERIKEEIYYREARKLGLDRNDTIVRRRLRQKVEFLLQDRVSNLTPSEAELAAHLKKHAARYRSDDRYTFSQVYLSRSRRSDKIADDVRRLLKTLEEAKGPVDVKRFGDPIMLPAHFADTTDRQIAATFGRDFARSLRQVRPGKWTGPIVSGYGVHVVRIEKRIPGTVPPLKEVHAAVKRDWLSERQKAAAAAFYKALRARYTVVIEKPTPAGKQKAER